MNKKTKVVFSVFFILLTIVGFGFYLMLDEEHDYRSNILVNLYSLQSDNLRVSFDNGLYETSINNKFPPGSDIVQVYQYVSSLNGKCNPDNGSSVSCIVPLHSKFCIYEKLSLKITVSGNLIRAIKTKTWIDAC